jgi:hypothetical protein
VTPELLTEILRGRQLLREARVTGVDTEIIGAGEGFLGTIARFKLTYDQPEDGAPASMVGKFPISSDQNRGMAQMGNMYEKEVRFYNELADRVPVKKPMLYHAVADPGPNVNLDTVERWLARIPAWLISRSLPALMWVGKRSKRRAALFIEDLAPARPGDQVKGCSLDEALVIVRQLGVMHAGWWDRAELDELDWIPPVNYLASFMARMVVKMRGDIEELAARQPIVRELVPWLDAHAVEIMDRLSEPPRTLLHGDYRLDNMALTGEGADVRMTLFDWQTMITGRGPFDLAYFVTGNLTVEEARKAEEPLLHAYHEALVANGVKGYDFEVCRRDYDLGKLAIFYRIHLANEVDFLDMQNARGDALFEAWIERLCALVPKSWNHLV